MCVYERVWEKDSWNRNSVKQKAVWECERGRQLTWCQLGAHIVPFPGGEADSETLNHFIHFKPILLPPTHPPKHCLCARNLPLPAALATFSLNCGLDESSLDLGGCDTAAMPHLEGNEVKDQKKGCFSYQILGEPSCLLNSRNSRNAIHFKPQVSFTYIFEQKFTLQRYDGGINDLLGS